MSHGSIVAQATRKRAKEGEDMEESKEAGALDEALRHCRAGLKALEAAQTGATASGQIYPTHLCVAAVELAHAIEVAMKLALRLQ